jgi:hypothetical protein
MLLEFYSSDLRLRLVEEKKENAGTKFRKRESEISIFSSGNNFAAYPIT